MNSETTLIGHSGQAPYPYSEWRFWRKDTQPVKTIADQDQRIAELQADNEALAREIAQSYEDVSERDRRIAELEAFQAFLRQSQFQGYPVWQVLEWWQSTKDHANPR
jgi:uncharacterized protein (DUF3084 family)